ncbi:LysR family transcriptional regulator [Salinisphaera aquimarina]|uniref:LysR family transcriptional regulator n=1 Tax=Salinisphaera aquimarina TaxID=2094031 RepID=A0ABV7EQY0_9GAMM
MEIRQLRYFVAVAEEKHFGHAAQRLHMTQPPLSMQIRQLEETLGIALLTRSTRQVALTDAGRVFLERARAILAELENTKQVTRHAESGLQGRLELGFISSATLTVLPPALRAFRARYPAVDLQLNEIASGHQVDALYDGRIRFGLLRLPLSAPGIHIEPLLRESLVVALPEHHTLASKDRLTMEDIAAQPLIFFRRQDVPGFHDHILQLFQAAGHPPQVVQRALHLQTIIGLVASGLGLSVLPGSSRHLRRDGVVYRPLAAPETETWLAMVQLDGERSVLLDNFRHELRTAAKNLAKSDWTISS